MRLRNLRLCVCNAILLLGCFAFASSRHGDYHLIKKYDLGAAPGGADYWDYITFDASTRYLYLSHGTEVKVVDADSGAVVGNISDLKRVHGIALVNELERGFISDGGADEAWFLTLRRSKLAATLRLAVIPTV